MNSRPTTADVDAAATLLHERLSPGTPVAAIVLGSGLGGLAARIDQPRQVAYADIPGFVPTTVAGHAGRVIAGLLAGQPVLAFAGRLHMYEGHSAATCAFPVRVAHALGVRVLLLSNAAGGIRRTFRPGDLMVINDHLNLSWRNPLIGPLLDGDQRFADMSEPYDADLRAHVHAAARSLGMSLHDGTYAWLSGPSYETPAEIRMLERCGADAVGMSTVPEVLVARAIGMRVAAVSCIANVASGLSAAPVSHAEVLAVTAAIGRRFEALAEAFVRRL